MERYINKDEKYINIDIQQSNSIYIILSDSVYFIKEFKNLLNKLNIYTINTNKRIVISKRLYKEKIDEMGGIRELIDKCLSIINTTCIMLKV